MTTKRLASRRFFLAWHKAWLGVDPIWLPAKSSAREQEMGNSLHDRLMAVLADQFERLDTPIETELDVAISQLEIRVLELKDIQSLRSRWSDVPVCPSAGCARRD